MGGIVYISVPWSCFDMILVLSTYLAVGWFPPLLSTKKDDGTWLTVECMNLPSNRWTLENKLRTTNINLYLPATTPSACVLSLYISWTRRTTQYQTYMLTSIESDRFSEYTMGGIVGGREWGKTDLLLSVLRIKLTSYIFIPGVSILLALPEFRVAAMISLSTFISFLRHRIEVWKTHEFPWDGGAHLV